MQIKDVEALVGITKKNIRFYEKEGLLSPARNAANDYRNYSDEDVAWLKKIKLLRKLSVPIEEIRLIRDQHITLDLLLERHMRRLEHDIRTLMQTQLLCSMMAEQGFTLDDLDADAYLLQMEDLEQEGVTFMDTAKLDIRRKYLGAIIPGVLTAAFMLVLGGVILYESVIDHVPFMVMVLVGVIFGGYPVAVIIALLQRMKEIRGGEEDAASKY